MFSTFIRHPQDLNIRAPVIILQYIVGLAVIEGIKSYESGYGEIPVRLKWPNDICACILSLLFSRIPQLT